MNEKNIKAIISLLIVLLAFGIFLLFFNYQENLLSPDNFYPFMVLTFVGMGLLLGLLFLVNRKQIVGKGKVVRVTKSSTKTSKKRK